MLEPAERKDETSEPPANDPLVGFARKILLSLLGLGVIGAIVGAGSMGTVSKFTASVVNSSNTFVAGTLKMDNNGTSACSKVVASTCGTLTLTSNTGMSPGDVATGTVTITNSGTLPASMTMTASVMSTSGLESYLNLTIHDDTTNTCIYGGSGSACDSLVGDASVVHAFTNISATSLLNTSGGSRWSSGEAHTFTVTVQVITTATTSQAGLSAVMDFIWAGAQ